MDRRTVTRPPVCPFRTARTSYGTAQGQGVCRCRQVGAYAVLCDPMSVPAQPLSFTGTVLFRCRRFRAAAQQSRHPRPVPQNSLNGTFR